MQEISFGDLLIATPVARIAQHIVVPIADGWVAAEFFHFGTFVGAIHKYGISLEIIKDDSEFHAAKKYSSLFNACILSTLMDSKNTGFMPDARENFLRTAEGINRLVEAYQSYPFIRFVFNRIETGRVYILTDPKNFRKPRNTKTGSI